MFMMVAEGCRYDLIAVRYSLTWPAQHPNLYTAALPAVPTKPCFSLLNLSFLLTLLFGGPGRLTADSRTAYTPPLI